MGSATPAAGAAGCCFSCCWRTACSVVCLSCGEGARQQGSSTFSAEWRQKEALQGSLLHQPRQPASTCSRAGGLKAAGLPAVQAASGVHRLQYARRGAQLCTRLISPGQMIPHRSWCQVCIDCSKAQHSTVQCSQSTIQPGTHLALLLVCRQPLPALLEKQVAEGGQLVRLPVTGGKVHNLPLGQTACIRVVKCRVGCRKEERQGSWSACTC